MTAITFRRPTIRPVHDAAWIRPAGNLDFRVTQRFTDPDSYYGDGRLHRAVDLGNTRCGEALVAMAPGTAWRIRDNATDLGAATDALGVRVDHGHGITTELWHLASYAVASGARVRAGEVIGLHGNTGLGAVCHVHVEAKRHGVRFDPEPLIFGGSVTIEGEEPDDMKLPPRLQAIVRGTVAAGARLRISPWTIEGALIRGSDTTVQVFGKGVRGQAYTVGDASGDAYAWVGFDGLAYYVAEPLVGSLQLPDAGDGGGVTSGATMEAIRAEAAVAADAIRKVEALAQ